MQMFHRKNGEEQPFWPAGPFKIRLPFVHYRWEFAEMVQALIMFVVSLAMIPLLETYLGVPYEVALAYVVICGIGFMLPALLGVPLVPGWITPGIPVVLLFLSDYEPGPEAIQALFALQFLVFLIFLVLGVTRLGSKLVEWIPRSMKGGIIIGAGIAALMGEIEAGGRLANTPISLIVGGLVCLYLMFSVSFKGFVDKSNIARKIANYGMVPGMVVAILVGFATGEYAVPDVQWGITKPAFDQLWNYLPFTVGFPDLNIFLYAIPTAVIAYVIAFGDIVVGQSLMNRVDHLRKDEDIDNSIDRVHLVTAIRNGGHLDGGHGHHGRALQVRPQRHGFHLQWWWHLLDYRLYRAVCSAAGELFPAGSADCAVADPAADRLHLSDGGPGATGEQHRARHCRHHGCGPGGVRCRLGPGHRCHPLLPD
jgi:hypothetical protein